MANVYVRHGALLVLDWGDSSIAHPFFSLVVPFRFLEERSGLAPGDPWFARLRAAYLEPWGSGLDGVVRLAERVGAFAHTFAWLRQRDHLEGVERAQFDERFPLVLGRALDQVREAR
jgi:hypothetical protein